MATKTRESRIVEAQPPPASASEVRARLEKEKRIAGSHYHTDRDGK